MTKPLPLADLQRWMLAAITHPAGVAAGAALGEIDNRLRPSRQQSAAERLAVYQSAYFARLLGVLRELFPCLRFAVGDELFDQFAVQYLQVHPPHSYTLHTLADQFADFLDATRPAGEWADFVVELARFEHALDQVFDGPGPENLPPSEPALEDAGKIGGDVHLTPSPGFRLLAFHYPVSSFYTAWKAGDEPPWPPPREQFVALLRRDYIVRRYEVTRPQHDLLRELVAGQSLAQTLQALSLGSNSADELAADLRSWFTFWSAERFFISLG